MIDFFKTKDFYLLFFIYLFSNILFLLNVNGVYWDGWVAFNQDDTTLFLFFEQIQHGLKGDLFIFFSHIGNGIYSFRVFTVISIFMMGVLFYLILQNIKEFNKNTLFFIVLFFMIIPINTAKISISVIPFLFPILIFYIAFYILTLYLKKPYLILRLFVLGLFFISFSTNSILVFYFSIFLYIYYFEFNLSYINIKDKLQYLLKKYWDFLLLPFIYFIYKSIYLKPTGLYEGYNQISLMNIPKAIKIIAKSIDNSFFEIILKSLYSTLSMWFLVFIIIYFIVKKTKLTFDEKYNTHFFIIGLLLCLLAIFPYAMVGKSAELESWNSRFQILLPFGLSFVFYFGILLLKKAMKFNDKIALILIWALLFSFVSKNISNQYEALKDSFYITSIGQNMLINDTIKNNSTFIVHNNIKDSLLYNRDPIYYELNGIMKKVFNDEKRLALNYKHYKNDFDNIKKLKQYKQYNFAQWKESRIFLITISYNYMNNYRTKDFINMIYYKMFDSIKFLKMTKQLVRITVEPLPRNECHE